MSKLRSFALPAFVADRASMETFGTGVQLDFTKFTDAKYGTAGTRRIPAGTIIEPVTTVGAPAYLCGPASGTAGNLALILKQDAEEDSKADAVTGYGAYSGGVVYQTLLPDATGNPRVLSSALKTQLGTFFRLMTYEDRR
ncbi:hypothetical protein DKM44_02280 [Deinococcus irradiatisoli]|uniref:Head decoration protein n=1 Tax=Deinococcus irradiatisoli TaxID=2202254 RepID=A0A2Z3JB83_9DEIO|nr:hypothetical protein [Deinococcus irradiatisoli]AWN22205.1 hypothetical protein DKM44_02280 [Deinococcus irradiatisoli]